MTRVKICGITSEPDALAAAEAGADALGFIFAPSPRRITLETARLIIHRLPPFVSSVGVFVDSSEDEIRDAVRYLDLDFVQLHGQESPDFCARFSNRAIKALRADKMVDMEQVAAYQNTARALLVDSGGGGTGKSFDWKALPPEFKHTRFILAGGLDPDNVHKAIGLVKPWAVDVSSGVETAPGIKDEQKIINFIQKVREADYGTT
ncbi:MAG: phosphoribosylanthranilate isomerase [Deltaproteobacteria bacterium]|nr:phosphoribosylanthranilate isomerase [Deltaproteobacteria bacterium]MBW2051230.1 phosphoribosylanthranilate isomerase [Deltaproteobacteria bacterium]MBW2141099.1 phosphoribosylanthranilate isomerase [Deltaproteobacteria bacterium]MBW2322977.1 phosphoribosylanthranilate isomerase [Deltaproteobacteria bacterium]